MKISALVLLSAFFSVFAQGAEVSYQLEGTLSVQSTAIRSNMDDACKSKAADTEELIARAQKADKNLLGSLSEKSEIGLSAGTVDCLYRNGPIGILCGSYHTNYACFTSITIASTVNRKLVFHSVDSAHGGMNQLIEALKQMNVVYSEIDRENASWVSVESK